MPQRESNHNVGYTSQSLQLNLTFEEQCFDKGLVATRKIFVSNSNPDLDVGIYCCWYPMPATSDVLWISIPYLKKNKNQAFDLLLIIAMQCQKPMITS